MFKRLLLFFIAASLLLAIDHIKLPNGSKVYVNDMNGFGAFVIAALGKKQVPLIVVTDREKADFEITGASDSQKAGWAKTIFLGQGGSREEASINVINMKDSTIAFAYAVNKSNSARGRQSSAEACAKHLKNAMKKKQ